ncbi:rhodanese-related sulfurtransferase [Ancylomarina euxinus]|uniref:tRNA uridine(34) hydroxylase n=1 Tax=Ancylomarina euxinus TaxID=2283627 RepID=A0A425Y276_9BACT|nr:rhodanese-related sulfurtransferase [Ancylomarina euxinus]MCZ4694870.1 rhodanese-related sulfurtransferase [Ancylomarina euxinus]MUP14736.1 rhodanese-related sulfurtransferase [Ancylomarina euxinus]RRG22083.1 rhodanese-related sulfurtransferase [Ancylomarina euxinus]
MQLHNKLSKEEAIKKLHAENFTRKTLSFYRYVILEDPQSFRDELFIEWDKLACLGRIYVAREGINAQMSVPEHHLEAFMRALSSRAELKDMPIKWAVEDDGKSFFKLIIKLRPKIVADGLDDGSFDVTNVGNHLSALEFHESLDQEDTVVIDMRNHYESEVGRFENAICPDVDTFREEIQMVVDDYSDKKDSKVLLYCTGGVRCEKASAYLKHHGFNDVNQLHGGIIEYARQIKQLGVQSKFIGKNFVFDERLGESIDGQVISKCHQCGAACDTHTNCANNDCHLLFIQCEACKEQYHGCCTDECKEIIALPEEERIQLRSKFHNTYSKSQIYRQRIRPKLNHS